MKKGALSRNTPNLLANSALEEEVFIQRSLGPSFANVHTMWLHKGPHELEAICVLNVLPMLKVAEEMLCLSWDPSLTV